MASLANVSRLLFAALALALPGARALAAEPAPSPADPERRCPGLIAGLPDVRFVNFERVRSAKARSASPMSAIRPS